MTSDTDIRGAAATVAAEARRVLAGNRQQGVSAWDGKEYSFVCPSRATYPFQWLWDSAFHAIALLHVDPELAKQELRCLAQGAHPDGFMPHMLLWEKAHHRAALEEYSIVISDQTPFHTVTTQPPVIARAVWRVYEATKDEAFLAELLPPTLRFFDWLRTNRDPDGDELIAIIQPDESGLDASPKFDVLMGMAELKRPEEVLPLLRVNMKRLFTAYAPYRQDPGSLVGLDVFNWEDVMVNTIYADGLRCLARLCRAAGYPASQAAAFDARAAAVQRAMDEKCWDEEAGLYWDLYGTSEQPARTLTFTSLFPLALETLDASRARRLVEEHLLNEEEFWLPYPVPSTAPGEPTFDPEWKTDTTWRGPTWVNANWYLYMGLKAHGYPEVATELARRTVRMLATGGVREFFNPYTAQGQGAVDFSWSTLVLDLIHAEGWGCGCWMEGV